MQATCNQPKAVQDHHSRGCEPQQSTQGALLHGDRLFFIKCSR